LGRDVAQPASKFATMRMARLDRRLLLRRIALRRRRKAAKEIRRKLAPRRRGSLGGRRRARRGRGRPARRCARGAAFGGARWRGSRGSPRSRRRWPRSRRIMKADVQVAIGTGQNDAIPRNGLHRTSGDRIAQTVAGHSLGGWIFEIRDRRPLSNHDAVEIRLRQGDGGSHRCWRGLAPGRAEQIARGDGRVRRGRRRRSSIDRIRGGGRPRRRARTSRVRRGPWGARRAHDQADEQGADREQDKVDRQEFLGHCAKYARSE
jgi:hypothetical protein